MKSKIHENQKTINIMSKKTILMMAIAIATFTVVSCDKKAKTINY